MRSLGFMVRGVAAVLDAQRFQRSGDRADRRCPPFALCQAVASRKLWLIDLESRRKILLEDVKSSPSLLVRPAGSLMSSVSVFLVPSQVKIEWVRSALAWILRARFPNRIRFTGCSEA